MRRLLLAISVLLGALPMVALSQNSPKAALLEQAAWAALNSGNAASAAAAFREALTLDAQNAPLHLGLGIVAFAQRRDDEAKSALDRTLDLNPALPGARELLGRVLYRTGDLDGAIRTYESVIASGAADEATAVALARWRREAELRDRMHMTGGAGFTVAFEGPEEAELAQRAVDSLGRSAERIAAALAYYPQRPISVVLYTREQFHDITRAPAWAAASFDGTLRIPVRGALHRAEELDRVLAHEYTHAIVHELSRNRAPAWLNEGLAVALERDLALSPPETPIRPSPLPRSFSQLTADEARRAYLSSGLAVQRLLAEAGAPALVLLLRDLGEGEDFEAAFERRIQRSFESFLAGLMAQP